jgi:hypothetical protein
LYCFLAAPPAGTGVLNPEAPRPVPQGYRKFSESDYFKFHAEGNAWVPARDTCEQERARLAVVNSEAEAKFISSLWNSKSDWAFIGTHDLYTEGTYVTIYSEYTKTYSVGKPGRKKPLGRPRRRWVDNIKMDLGEMGWYGLDRTGSG